MPRLFPRTGISVVTDKIGSLRVFYQLKSGKIQQSRQLNGVWTDKELTFNPAKGTPLASITYDAGKEVSRPPHIPGAPPDWSAGRSMYTTLTKTPKSKSTATLKGKAGILERSANWVSRLAPSLASPPLCTAPTCLALVKKVFTFVFTV